jgi:hypothetical protein
MKCVFVVIIVTFTLQPPLARGQPNTYLNKIWELEEIEPLKATMGSIGEEFAEVDLRHDSLMVFKGGDKYDSVTYKVTGDELAIFDRKGKQLGAQIIWKIEDLTTSRFVLMFINTIDNAELLRLRYRAK